MKAIFVLTGMLLWGTSFASNVFDLNISPVSSFDSLSPAAYPNAISPQQAKEWLDNQSAILIDIREQSEIASGMAAPAIWFPKSSIDANESSFLEFLSKNAAGKEVILYCRSGRRASVVVDRMSTHSIKVWNMGGFQDWIDAKLPTKTPDFY